MSNYPESFQDQLLDRTIRFAVDVMGATDSKRVMDRLLGSRVLVTGQMDLLRTAAGQIMASTAVNILARYAGRLAFGIREDIPLTIPVPFARSTTLLGHLLDLCRSINPQIEATTDRKGATVLVAVGTAEADAPARISINAAGWNAYVSTLGDGFSWRAEHNCPFGALTAAALGASEVFKRLLSIVPGVMPRAVAPLGRLAFSTFDAAWTRGPELNPALPEVVDLGTVDVVSVGAITSAMLWSLYMIPGVQLAGRGIDGQGLDFTNLGRYLLVEARDAAAETNKAVALLPKVADRLHLQPIPLDFEVYRDGGALLGHEPSVLGVDNDPARWAVQSTWPPMIICSGTEIDLVQVFTWKGDPAEACVGCLYPRRSGSLERSTIPVPTAPFVSALAGILTAVELVKQTLTTLSECRSGTAINLPVLHPHHAYVWRPLPDRACAVQCSASRST